MSRLSLPVCLILLTGIALSGCIEADGTAGASLHRVTPYGAGIGDAVYGHANFTQEGGEVTIHVEVRNLDAIDSFEPGPKGTHIHENGDCSPSWDGSTATAGGNAGGHFNPDGHDHPGHSGDLGNMDVDKNGDGLLEVMVTNINLGTNETHDVVGRAVVIHAGEDDLESQPSGAAGPRFLCGVIRAT